jgi:hypothetical protein
VERGGMPALLATRVAFSLNRRQQSIWIIHVKRLMVWHRKISRNCLTGSQPGILINSHLENRL